MIIEWYIEGLWEQGLTTGITKTQYLFFIELISWLQHGIGQKFYKPLNI